MSTMHMLTHTRAHTADPYNSLIKWKPWYPFLHPRVNEYQWETDMTVLGMCVCMRVCAHLCVYACDWMIDKEKRKIVPYSQVLFWTGYVAVWDFFSITFFFLFYLIHSSPWHLDLYCSQSIDHLLSQVMRRSCIISFALAVPGDIFLLH